MDARKLVKNPFARNLGGLSLAVGTRLWMRTLAYRAALYDPTVDPPHPEFRGPAIFLFWHEYIPFMFYLRSHNKVSLLVSQHGDAEWLAQASRHMGFGTVRGSSTRGGVAALKQMFAASRLHNLAITPDGPRGPRRRLAPGCIFLASRLGMPLVPVGLGYDRPWRVNTWDRFAIPRPGSRARAISAPFVHVPPNLCRDGIELYRGKVEKLLLDLTYEAEDWARTGRYVTNESPLRREHSSRRQQLESTFKLRISGDDHEPSRRQVA
ncbi:MAG TPA: hypothetical protein DCY79_00085 [Planctomycetaceae bacterium]|nr:hypothetical protein [Planctomycetaceae bacterium]